LNDEQTAAMQCIVNPGCTIIETAGEVDLAKRSQEIPEQQWSQNIRSQHNKGSYNLWWRSFLHSGCFGGSFSIAAIML
jgi:hypothetical protein